MEKEIKGIAIESEVFSSASPAQLDVTHLIIFTIPTQQFAPQPLRDIAVVFGDQQGGFKKQKYLRFGQY